MAVVNSNGIFKNPLSTSTFILPPTTTLPQIHVVPVVLNKQYQWDIIHACIEYNISINSCRYNNDNVTRV